MNSLDETSPKIPDTCEEIGQWRLRVCLELMKKKHKIQKFPLVHLPRIFISFSSLSSCFNNGFPFRTMKTFISRFHLKEVSSGQWRFYLKIPSSFVLWQVPMNFTRDSISLSVHVMYFVSYCYSYWPVLTICFWLSRQVVTNSRLRASHTLPIW